MGIFRRQGNKRPTPDQLQFYRNWIEMTMGSIFFGFFAIIITIIINTAAMHNLFNMDTNGLTSIMINGIILLAYVCLSTYLVINVLKSIDKDNILFTDLTRKNIDSLQTMITPISNINTKKKLKPLPSMIKNKKKLDNFNKSSNDPNF